MNVTTRQGKPSKTRVSPFLLLLACLLAPVASQGQGRLEYEVQYGSARQDRVSVRLTMPEAIAGPRPFVFPRAIPMGYGEQAFDGFVGNVRAFSERRERLSVLRPDPPRWIIGDRNSRIKILEYEVDIVRMEREILSGADASKVRNGYVGLLGYSIFGFLAGTEELPIRLRISGPPEWPIFSTLAPRVPAGRGTFTAQAPNFYSLADAQILLGPNLKLRRLDGKIPLFLAVYAEGPLSLAILEGIFREAFESIAAYFGHIPFPHYTACQEYLRPISERHEYGFSMEHLESGTFFFSSDQAPTERSPADQVSRTRYNLAHHIAHAWIPKRSYGEGYYPFSWERAPLIDTIWFSEGFPQYAAIEALADTMPDLDATAFRNAMLDSRFRSNLREAPEFIRRLSLVELSRLASTRYSEDFRIGRNIFSRGGMMAAEMDERIRLESGRRFRLRDALRFLVSWSARTGRAFKIDELPSIFAQATGIDTRDILQRWLPAPAP